MFGRFYDRCTCTFLLRSADCWRLCVRCVSINAILYNLILPLRSALDYHFLFPMLIKIPIIAVQCLPGLMSCLGCGTVHERGGRRPVFARPYKNPSYMPLFDSNICQVRKSSLLSLG